MKKKSDPHEDAIVKAYSLGILPSLSSSQVEQFELLIWKTIEEEGNLLSYTSADALPILSKSSKTCSSTTETILQK